MSRIDYVIYGAALAVLATLVYRAFSPRYVPAISVDMDADIQTDPYLVEMLEEAIRRGRQPQS